MIIFVFSSSSRRYRVLSFSLLSSPLSASILLVTRLRLSLFLLPSTCFCLPLPLLVLSLLRFFLSFVYDITLFSSLLLAFLSCCLSAVVSSLLSPLPASRFLVTRLGLCRSLPLSPLGSLFLVTLCGCIASPLPSPLLGLFFLSLSAVVSSLLALILFFLFPVCSYPVNYRSRGYVVVSSSPPLPSSPSSCPCLIESSTICFRGYAIVARSHVASISIYS